MERDRKIKYRSTFFMTEFSNFTDFANILLRKYLYSTQPFQMKCRCDDKRFAYNK